MILINPVVIHHQLQLVFDALKYAANQFVKADRNYLPWWDSVSSMEQTSTLVSFATPSTFAVSIYSLFYLLYILYPNNLRRELQPDGQPTISSHERSHNRLGIEKVLSVCPASTSFSVWNQAELSFSHCSTILNSIQVSSVDQPILNDKKIAGQLNTGNISSPAAIVSVLPWEASMIDRFLVDDLVCRLRWCIVVALQWFQKTQRGRSTACIGFQSSRFDPCHAASDRLSSSLTLITFFICAMTMQKVSYICVKTKVR